MNIIEAIKSGKRFRRSWHADYSKTEFPLRDLNPRFSCEDILAEDWEIEEEKVLLGVAGHQARK